MIIWHYFLKGKSQIVFGTKNSNVIDRLQIILQLRWAKIPPTQKQRQHNSIYSEPTGTIRQHSSSFLLPI